MFFELFVHCDNQGLLAGRYEMLCAMVDNMLSFQKFGASAEVCRFLEIESHVRPETEKQ